MKCVVLLLLVVCMWSATSAQWTRPPTTTTSAQWTRPPTAPTTTTTTPTTTAPTTTTPTTAPTTTTTTTTPLTTAPTTPTPTTAPTTTTTAPTTTTTTPTTAPTTTTPTTAPTTTKTPTTAPTTTKTPTTAPTTTKTPITITPSSTPTIAPSDWIAATLADHNKARAAVGLRDLVWNATAAAVAQNYASQCVYGHNSNRGPYGENIAANAPGSTQPSVGTAQSGVQSWVSEKQYFDCKSNVCTSGQACGHYTQVTWSATTSVGCAVVRCDKNTPFGDSFPTWNFMVCDYATPGNFVGQAPFTC